jgi:hypothetical protein
MQGLPWHISGSTVIRESKALLDIEEFYTAGPGLQADHTTFDRTFYELETATNVDRIISSMRCGFQLLIDATTG